MTAAEAIALLGLAPHPEGGHYRETWRAAAKPGERAAGTAIYFLLKAGETSRWHRIDAAELWHWYAGAALELAMPDEVAILGNDLAAGQRPQLLVPPDTWQSARPLGAWTLAGCTVTPGFRFEGFELARDGWTPARRDGTMASDQGG